MKKIFSRIYSHVINPPSDDELKRAWQKSEIQLPVLWLLGKTGSGKSSIVQQLTGKSGAEIGSGFRPCTRESSYYDYPREHPILRFLDTRGLGEVDYDAKEDIGELGSRSHAVLVVARIMDPEQGAVLDALKQVRSSAGHIRREAIIAVHTGADELPDGHDRQRAIETQQTAIESAWKSPADSCATGFGKQADSGELNDLGADELRVLIAQKVPELSIWLTRSAHRDAEHENFEKLKTEVLWYAGSAAASDAIPLVGLVSVPAVQGKMLHSLAGRYGVEWNARNFSEFTAALGTSFALRYATGLGARQLAKLVPGFGQLVGSAFAMTVSYASTYALGRAACGYLYHKKTATEIGEGDLSALYTGALEQGRRAGREALRGDRE